MKHQLLEILPINTWKAREKTEGLVAPVALFEEWVAIHVVAVAIPECLACQRAGFITQLDAVSPLQNDY